MISKQKSIVAAIVALGLAATPCAFRPTGEADGAGTAALAAAAFMRGDANDDGEITLADAIHVAVYLFAHGPAPLPSEDSGDANCDSRVDPGDVVYLINYTLRGGPKPKCPA